MAGHRLLLIVCGSMVVLESVYIPRKRGKRRRLPEIACDRQRKAFHKNRIASHSRYGLQEDRREVLANDRLRVIRFGINELWPSTARADTRQTGNVTRNLTGRESALEQPR